MSVTLASTVLVLRFFGVFLYRALTCAKSKWLVYWLIGDVFIWCTRVALFQNQKLLLKRFGFFICWHTLFVFFYKVYRNIENICFGTIFMFWTIKFKKKNVFLGFLTLGGNWGSMFILEKNFAESEFVENFLSSCLYSRYFVMSLIDSEQIDYNFLKNQFFHFWRVSFYRE